MMIYHKDPLESVSEKKQKLIETFKSSDFQIGEIIIVPENLVKSWKSESTKPIEVKVLEVNKKTLIVTNFRYEDVASKYTINKSDVLKRKTQHIGANPFDEKFDSIRMVAFQLSSIIHSLDLTKDRRKFRSDDKPIVMNGVEVKELNWNPYVFDKNGNKQYYQRDFCWSLNDKQLLIESIYNKIDCGKILIRLHSWNKLKNLANKGETELAFKDIVDGKQRMKTIQEFIFNEFPDIHGNYYNDLSAHAQYSFGDHQLFAYAEMPESTTDEEVVYQFLKMNFSGVPQSQEHLNYVKELSKTLK